MTPGPATPALALDERFVRYLESKVSVDDRALNQNVLAALRRELAAREGRRLRVREIGGGLGTMLARLLDWKFLARADYELRDLDRTLLERARIWLAAWAKQRGFQVAATTAGLTIHAKGVDLTVRFVCADANARSERAPDGATDLLIANAVLDVLDVPSALPRLLGELDPDGLFWFSINFDGETIFQPELPADEALLRVYHRSMDERIRNGMPSGDSKTGRHLFQQIPKAGGVVLAAGASDWVVHAVNGRYPARELEFLEHILDTVGAELVKHADVEPHVLEGWLAERRAQAKAGELVYVAHQLDFLGKKRA